MDGAEKPWSTSARPRFGTPTLREQAKHARRRRIVAAARQLVHEGGIDHLSMRLLAERAGVSIATPYNLFGSKQAVMLAVIDEDIAHFLARLAGISAPNALELLFRAIAVAREVYAAEPNFYRAVLLAVYNSGGREFRAMFSGPRRRFWQNLVSRAMKEGHIREGVAVGPLTLQLAHVFASVQLNWVLGDITLDRMERQIEYGFALSLLGVATDAASPALHTRFEAAQAALTGSE